jgi:hypothetical protein
MSQYKDKEIYYPNITFKNYILSNLAALVKLPVPFEGLCLTDSFSAVQVVGTVRVCRGERWWCGDW